MKSKSRQLPVVIFTTLLFQLYLLHADPGSLDGSFDCGTNLGGTVFGGSAVGTSCIAVQPDGKVIAGGNFAVVNNDAGVRMLLARFDTNGAPDESFNRPPYFLDSAPGGHMVNSILVEPDGTILVGGNFLVVKELPPGQGFESTALNLTRLTPAGIIDNNFPTLNVGTTAKDVVNAMALQRDGRILIGGYIGNFAVGNASGPYTFEAPVTNLFRLDCHGNLDASFKPALATNFLVYSIVLQNDQKIVVGGAFVVSNVASGEVIRLNTDGSLDSSFSPASGSSGVTSLAIQSDGRVVVAGETSSFPAVWRLNTNGSFDTGFNSSLKSSGLRVSLALQPDGKLIVGGITASNNGVTYNDIARVNMDGSLDTNFVPVNTSQVLSVALQPDGRILFGGAFTQVNSLKRQHLARLDGDPLLSFATTPGYDVVSWPATYTNYSLQFKTNLSSPSWMDDPNPQVSVSNYFVVTNLIESGNKFYQLKK